MFPKNKLFAAKIILLLVSAILLLNLFSDSCAPKMSNDDYYFSRIAQLSRPYAFSYAGYEMGKIAGALQSIGKSPEQPGFEDNLREQILSVLHEQGISVFPPLEFSMETPPHLLVVSPRDRILYYDRAVLLQDMSIEQRESLESSIDALGLSSLVDDLGGFGGTYPSLVSDEGSMRFLLNTIAEEWLHQYLVFKPLGFRYLLDCIGIKQEPDIVTINETAVGIVSREIGGEVYSRYYNNSVTNNKSGNSFDFDAEMRETRKQVDELLKSGKIDEAEAYMEARRQYFIQNGYYIRKLNQAYFAFHGIYGESPAAVSPIYGELEDLRARSGNAKNFLDTVSSFKSYNDLKNSLK
jgi:hypothetical protein